MSAYEALSTGCSTTISGGAMPSCRRAARRALGANSLGLDPPVRPYYGPLVGCERQDVYISTYSDKGMIHKGHMKSC